MSFVLFAKKNQLYRKDWEPLTSGSVGVYTVRFEFSGEWDGFDKTVSFRYGHQTVSTLLDQNGCCTIPWEIIDHCESGAKLYAGVCGTKDGRTVLPTVWGSLGEVLEGTSCGQYARPPTPGIWEQKLSQMQNRITELEAMLPRSMTAEELQNILYGGKENE